MQTSFSMLNRSGLLSMMLNIQSLWNMRGCTLYDTSAELMILLLLFSCKSWVILGAFSSGLLVVNYRNFKCVYFLYMNTYCRITFHIYNDKLSMVHIYRKVFAFMMHNLKEQDSSDKEWKEIMQSRKKKIYVKIVSFPVYRGYYLI